MALLRKTSRRNKPSQDANSESIIAIESSDQLHEQLKTCSNMLQRAGIGFFFFQYQQNKLEISDALLTVLQPCLLGKHIETPADLIELAHPDSRPAWEELFRAPKSTKKNISFVTKFISPQKEPKEILIFELTGYYEGLLPDSLTLNVLLRDISKESKLIKDLQKNMEKAQKSDQIKTNFLLDISHNIRTPMNSILGFAELLSLTDPGAERRKEYIQVIKKQSKSLLQLIDDVAEIARFDSGTVNISKSPVNINLLLNEVIKDLENLRATSRHENVRIAIQVPSKEGIELYTDGGRLHQVFINLANHALKNTTEGVIKMGYQPPAENRINFFVSDTSPGYTKDEIKVLFDRYLIGSDEDTKRYSEEGNLGLGIARSIVKLLGGKISAESEPGQGLTIHFSIPYEKEPVEIPEMMEEEDFGLQYNWSDKVVLIVEDEDVNGLFLEAVFQDTGAQTIFAKNGRQAVDLCQSINKIDLILMDIRMPVMNGILATKEIRKFNHIVPIIAQTAMAHIEDRENCLLAGCNDYVTKPIDVEDLLKMVNQYLAT